MTSVGEGPVETVVMPPDHQNEKTYIFTLPRELLVSIFKAQSSITGKSYRLLLPSCTSSCTRMQKEQSMDQVVHQDLQLMQNIDAVHLARTCHYLRNLYKSEHTVARTVLQREIPCYEVRIT